MGNPRSSGYWCKIFLLLWLVCCVFSLPRVRNYASNECGAKVIAANEGAEGTSRILNEMVDEYLLNPCKSPIWFVIELCDFLQPHLLELANYELFSSTPKDFMIFGSENYPTNEWTNLGSFSAEDTRVIQRFELLSQSQFLKFLKIVITSHHGREHYCPLSVVRVFGTSMLEELDAIEGGGSNEKFKYQPDLPLEQPTTPHQEDAVKRTNTIGSAHEAVMAVVRRAAMALSRFSRQDDVGPSEIDSSNETTPKFDIDDVYGLSLNSLKLMPWLETKLSKCKDCVQYDERIYSTSPAFPTSSFQQPLTPSPTSQNLPTCKTSPNELLCDYVKSMLGLKTYAIMCEEIRKEPYLRFRCPLVTYFLNYTLPSVLIFEQNLLPSYPLTRPSFDDTFHDSVYQPPNSQFHEASTHSSEEALEQTEKAERNLSPTSVLGEKLSSLTSILVEPLLSNEDKDSQNNATIPENMPSESALPTVLPENLSESIKISNETQKAITSPAYDRKDSHSTSESISESLMGPNVSSSGSPLTQQLPIVTGNGDVSNGQVASGSIPVSQQPTPQSPFNAAGVGDAVTGSNGANWIPISASQAKESVFIRMSNKIKALEFNLSLSTQYLEEFSQKFRKNMDDVQRAFNRTINKLNETALLAEEKDTKQQEMLEILQDRLILLQKEVKYLRDNDSINWQIIEVHLVLFFVEFSVMICVLIVCWRKTTRHLEEKYQCNQLEIRKNPSTNRQDPIPLKTASSNVTSTNYNHNHEFNRDLFSAREFPAMPIKRLNSCPELIELLACKTDRDIYKYNDLRRYGSTKTKDWAPAVPVYSNKLFIQQ